MRKIVILESEEILLAAIEFRLRKHGYKVVYCPRTEDIPTFVLKEEPEMVIVDLDMRRGIGLAVIGSIREVFPGPLGILLVANPEDEEGIIESFTLGVDDFLPKPFKPAELILRTLRIFMRLDQNRQA